MKQFLKYLIPAIIALFLVDGAKKSDFIAEEYSADRVELEALVSDIDYSVCTSDFYLPVQVVTAHVFRGHTTCKRTHNAYRFIQIFARANKSFKISVGNSIHKNSLILYSSLTEPIHRLIRLGKLVI